METKYGTNDKGAALVNAIPENHVGYIDITKAEWGDLVEGVNNPPKTYSQALSELNSDKKAKEKDFAEKFALIIARNGVTEDPAKTGIRSTLLAKIDSDYAAAKTALNLKYYGA